MHTKAAAVLGGIGIGSGLMFFMDPNGGKRRRAKVRNRVARVANVSGGALGKTGRDVANRASGVAAMASRMFRKAERVSDEVLEARIRSKLGRIVSHPSALEVTVYNGRVTLGGPVHTNEVSRVMSTVWTIPGVQQVENRMSEHKETVPHPQSGSWERRFERLRDEWPPAWRVLMGASGGALAVYGFSRRDPWWSAAGAVGATLLARSVTNREIRRGFGLIGRRAA